MKYNKYVLIFIIPLILSINSFSELDAGKVAGQTPSLLKASVTTTNQFIYTNATGFIAAQLDGSGNVTNYLFRAGTNSANFAF